MNEAHSHVKEELTKALRALGVDSPRVILEKPRDAQHGDIATNVAMTHAKDLKKPPRALAEELLSRIKLDRKLIASENIAGPGFIRSVVLTYTV